MHDIGPNASPTTSRIPRAVWLLLIFVLALHAPTIARAGLADPEFPGVDGSVSCMTLVDQTLYIGGAFNAVGTPTGGCAQFGPAMGAVVKNFPRVLGAVFAVASDGAGGWFIGGDFTLVGGQPRRNLAHVLSDMSVSPWNPGTGGSEDDVFAIAVSGSTVYVGGQFGNLGGRARLAAIDAVTGRVSSWAPNPDDNVVALAVTHSTVYIGGYFQRVGGRTRRFLAAISRTSGKATRWNPSPDQPPLAIVRTGSNIVLGGIFGTISGQNRAGLAQFRTKTGRLTAWGPAANGGVYALAASGSTLFVGGEFSAIGGVARSRLAAVDLATGSTLAWDPGADHAVSTLAVAGGLVFAGGGFTAVGGRPRNYLAAIDITTGTVSAWDPAVDTRVVAVAANASGTVAGGFFRIANVLPRANLAAIDLTTKHITDWNPGANGAVQAMTRLGSRLYVGGQFSSVGGQPRSLLAAFDLATGALNSWSTELRGGFNFGGSEWSPQVLALASNADVVYVAGKFTSIGGQPRGPLAALDPVTALPTSWDPMTGISPADFAVLTVSSDESHAYVATKGLSFLAWDGATGSLTQVKFANDLPRRVLASGGRVYVAGDFTTLDGQPRDRIAGVNRVTGTMLGWNPGANGSVRSLATEGAMVYVGGEFTVIGGQPRAGIAALDSASGAPSAWNPGLNGVPSAIVPHGNVVYVGGSFSVSDGVPTFGLAAFAALGALPALPALSAPSAPSAQPSPRALLLRSAVPNPTRVESAIRFSLPRALSADLMLIDVTGRAVRTLFTNRPLPAGEQEVRFSRGGLAPGLYFLRLRAGSEVSVTKVVVAP